MLTAASVVSVRVQQAEDLQRIEGERVFGFRMGVFELRGSFVLGPWRSEGVECWVKERVVSSHNGCLGSPFGGRRHAGRARRAAG